MSTEQVILNKHQLQSVSSMDTNVFDWRALMNDASINGKLYRLCIANNRKPGKFTWLAFEQSDNGSWVDVWCDELITDNPNDALKAFMFWLEEPISVKEADPVIYNWLMDRTHAEINRRKGNNPT